MLQKYTVLICAVLICFANAALGDLYDDSESDVVENEPLIEVEKEPLSSHSFRLPNNTIPLHYDVWLSTEIHVPIFDFNGVVTIRLRAVEDSSEIVVNYKQLNIINIDFLDSNQQLIQPNVNFELREAVEMISIRPTRKLIANQEYHVRINYRGVLRTDNYGFYRASYIDEEGNRIWYATTQFQATDCRHAFPSYDEPHYRTSFTTMIRHHPRLRAVSNMPVQSVFKEPTGFTVTTFQRVQSMQTYLNAYLVADFLYAEDLTVVPPQRIYAKPFSIHNKEYEFALRESPKIMLGCEQYYGMNYSFPKMDQVAVTDFPAGAEDWGLVSYREPLLLFDPNVGRTIDIDNIIRLIAHEFMHQFVGNMVSPQWWSYLWLNEGTATMDQYLIPHIIWPNERYDDTFISNRLQTVFEIDSNPNIRAMTHYVEDPASILRLFDSISYPKAASVLHTFRHAFGESTWQKGMHNYLVTRYDNFANSAHLYAAIQMAVDEDFPVNKRHNVAALMSTWELQPGFPVLSVTRTGDLITITQERFFYDQNLRSPNLYQIPINYVVGSNPDFRPPATPDFWMNGVRTIRINNANATKRWTSNDWMIFNIRQNYYYRVNYDSTLWRLIIEQLNGGGDSFTQIDYRNRAQLLDDAFHLARAQKIDFGVVFRIFDYLWQEYDHHPWVSANRASTALNRWLSGSIIYANYQEFVRRNINGMFTRLGVQWREVEHRFDRHSRTLAMVLACEAQLPECLQQTNEELISYITQGRRIAPDYIPTIYCQGMRIGNGLLFMQTQNRLFRSTIQTERNNIITGIGCSQNTDLLFVFLSLAITPDIPLSLAEKQRILTAPAPRGEAALSVMIDFTRFNFESITGLSANLLNTMLTNIASHIGSESLFDNFVSLLDHLLRNQAITQTNFNTHRVNARVNLNWQNLNMQPIMEFFYGRQQPIPMN